MAAGKFAMVENLSFSQKAGVAVDYAYAPAGPAAPWDISSVAYEPQKAIDLGTSGRELHFRAKPAQAGDVQTMIAVVLTATPVPTETGFVLDFKPQCHDAPICEISFSRLPGGATLQLLSAAKSPFAEPRILATRSGESVKFETPEIQAAESIRLIAADTSSRDATFAAWNKAEVMTRMGTEITVFPDSIVRVETAADTLKGKMHNRVAFFRGPANGMGYQVARTQNIDGGYISRYIESDLKLETDSSSYGYSLLGAITAEDAQTSRLVIPISARSNLYANLAEEQKTPQYIATHEKISLQLPTGFASKPLLFECLEYHSASCSKTRHIAADATVEGEIITLHPREAQISGLWLLVADMTGGKFSKPSAWTRFTFGLSHYHKFGQYPRWAFWFWFMLIVGSIIAAISVFVWLGRRKHRRAEQAALQAKENQVVQDLLKRDPQFHLENFRSRAKLIAEKIQHAWSAGDMRECRRFLSQGVYNRFRLQLQIMREREKRQNAMADFRVARIMLTERRRSGAYDAIIVRLDAEARDTMVGAELGPAAAQTAAKKAPLTRFTEFYTLVRKRTAKTEQPGLADACSHCGTPFTGEGEITKCKSCGAVMGSGTYDWVLAEITQQSEYSANAPRKKLAEDVSPDRIEDRASFVFWRQLMARLTGNGAYISRDASDAYLKEAAGAENLYDIAVGAAELESYNSADAACSAKVRIKWSAAASKGEPVRHRESVLLLTATKNDVLGSGFAEHGCNSCGAPLPETDSMECTYCHSPIQRKNADWLLESVTTSVE